MEANISHGIWGFVVAVMVVIAFQSALVWRARLRNKGVTLFDLIVTTEDNRYSLSRLQFYLWFVTILVSYWGVCAAWHELRGVPETLWALMGLNTASTVSSSAIVVAKGQTSSSNPVGRPQFFADIFLDRYNTLDLPRTQLFLWTVVIVLGYLYEVAKSFHNGSPALPYLDPGLVGLMGISHGAYLGAKAVEPSQKLLFVPAGPVMPPGLPGPSPLVPSISSSPPSGQGGSALSGIPPVGKGGVPMKQPDKRE